MNLRRSKIAILTLILLLVCGSGCPNTRTILVPTGEPVRFRQTVPNVKVWVADKDGVWVEGVMDIPEGWYALPDSGE